MVAEWIGTLLLLAVLFLVVPALFMIVITIQFRFIEHTAPPRPRGLPGPEEEAG